MNYENGDRKLLPKEKDFEYTLENYLVSTGYEQGVSGDFDLEYCIFKTDLFRFLEQTQGELLDEFKKSRGVSWQKALLDRLDIEIRNRGLIDVLRSGITDYSVNGTIQLMYFRPNSTLNPNAMTKYNENIFKVTRQFKYSLQHNNSIDTVISINGLPVIAIELKNKFTGQNIQHAIKQFKQDRNPKEKIFTFNQRVLVYFAVDNDEVYMTTELKGPKTFFLPFNRGNNRGKGNPEVEGKYKTFYLWENILTKDSLSDIIKRFYFIETDEKGNKKAIFPRYHQLDAVRKVVSDLINTGAGQNYLIQHSAGSGKTNTISWLSHRLSSLHSENDENIFDSVIVVTDRKVLDKQLQDAVYQLEHQQGLVAKIDDKKTSTDLANAITSGVKIIITTIQKFPFALQKIDSLEKRKYAVIIDEAHSSTAGENMGALKETLAGKTLEEAAREEQYEQSSLDKMEELIEKRTNLQNISFFAFTATPKNKTLQVFGRIGEDSKPHEFHLYSMKQAIEEGFILDVLKNYLPVDVYYKVGKQIESNPEFDKGEAKRAITKYINLHEHNIRQKVEMIVDDFMNNRVMWIDGKAKGMIVTASRLHAVRYKLAIDKYIAEKGYRMKTLVAFSGTVVDNAEEYTEVKMNGDISESELPHVFNKDEYKLLIVAEKYQTGFDQPKLCTMYVDKKLDGVKTVQTLSRLNRTYPNKQTFILDFQNTVEDIQDAYKPYFEVTEIDKLTDPNVVNDLWYQLHEYGVYTDREVEEFVVLFYKEKRTPGQDATMNNIIDKGVERFNNLNDEKREDEFKKKAAKYITFYNFLLQIYPLRNLNLLRLQIYLAALLKKLPKKSKDRIDLDKLLSLDYYKLQRLSQDGKKGQDISLQQGEGELVGISENAQGRVKEANEEYLDDIIKKINEIFGIGLTEDDRVYVEQYADMFKNDSTILDIARANTEEDFKKTFARSYFTRGIVKAQKKNERIVKEIFSNPNFKNFMIHYITDHIYNEVNK